MFAHNGWPFEILEQQEVILSQPEILRSKVTEVKTEVKVISRENTPVTDDNEEDLGTTKVGTSFHVFGVLPSSGGSGISQTGCANPKRGASTYYLANFSQKLHENEEILG